MFCLHIQCSRISKCKCFCVPFYPSPPNWFLVNSQCSFCEFLFSFSFSVFFCFVPQPLSLHFSLSWFPFNWLKTFREGLLLFVSRFWHHFDIDNGPWFSIYFTLYERKTLLNRRIWSVEKMMLNIASMCGLYMFTARVADGRWNDDGGLRQNQHSYIWKFGDIETMAMLQAIYKCSREYRVKVREREIDRGRSCSCTVYVFCFDKYTCIVCMLCTCLRQFCCVRKICIKMASKVVL